MTEEEEEVFIYSLPKSTLSKNDLRNMLDLSSETLVMNSLASIPELINLGWNSTTSYCTWTGVTCTGLLQVQGIDISGSFYFRSLRIFFPIFVLIFIILKELIITIGLMMARELTYTMEEDWN